MKMTPILWGGNTVINAKCLTVLGIKAKATSFISLSNFISCLLTAPSLHPHCHCFNPETDHFLSWLQQKQPYQVFSLFLYLLYLTQTSFQSLVILSTTPPYSTQNANPNMLFANSESLAIRINIQSSEHYNLRFLTEAIKSLCKSIQVLRYIIPFYYISFSGSKLPFMDL